jgi:endothelin-converting enzyme
MKTSQSSLISAGTGADDKDPDTVVVMAGAPWSVGLPAKELYKDDKVVKRYKQTISEVFSALQEQGVLQSIDANALVDFEKAIAAITPSAEDSNDVTVSIKPSQQFRCINISSEILQSHVIERR